jgi:predicted DNA-binding antitoxin AbrB/MazE fold protein
MIEKRIEAVYEGGVLRLVEPLEFPEGQRVWITIQRRPPSDDPLADLIDEDYHEWCLQHAPANPPTIEEVRAATSKSSGSIQDDIRAERDDR